MGPILREICQVQNLLGEHSVGRRLTRRLYHSLGIRTELRRLLRRNHTAHLGAPSRFAPGSHVRVLDAAAVRETLDAHDSLRGLAFVSQQWPYCGGVFRVRQHVRRILDDHGRMRPVGRTVLLEGPTCAGVDGREGCGRHCPLFFRDEWLAPAPDPQPPVATTESPAAAAVDAGRWVRVRPLAEIRSTLAPDGRCDGLHFMPEMEAYVDRRFRVRLRLAALFELDRQTTARMPSFLLEGLHCSGEILGRRGPCHRGCALVWHGSWLEFDG